MDQSNSSVSVQTSKVTYLTIPYFNPTKSLLVEVHFDYPLNKVIVRGTIQDIQDEINKNNKG